MDADTEIGPRSPAPPATPPVESSSPSDRSKRFLRLFLQNQRTLYAYILTLLPHRNDADDVLQETSIVMWDKFDADDPPADFLAWARRVAYHKVLDFYKKSNRASARLGRVFVDRIAASTEHADAPALDDRRAALAGCIEKLTPKDRDLLALRFADGATTQSTSERVGRSVDAVYKALAKLRHTLFDCVQKTLAQEGQA